MVEYNHIICTNFFSGILQKRTVTLFLALSSDFFAPILMTKSEDIIMLEQVLEHNPLRPIK